MKLWALIENGAVVGFWRAAAMPTTPGTWIDCGEQTPALGSTYANGAFTAVKPQKITGTQFINRLTLQEQTALATAAQGNAQMLLMMVRLAAAGTVDLTDPEVIGGVNGLVSTVLTAPRAAAILDH